MGYAPTNTDSASRCCSLLKIQAIKYKWYSAQQLSSLRHLERLKTMTLTPRIGISIGGVLIPVALVDELLM